MSVKNLAAGFYTSVSNFKEFLKDSALINGLIMKSVTLNCTENLPVTIFPSPYPEYLLENVSRLQKDFQLLFNKLSRDHEALFQILQCIIETDDYIKKIWDIYNVILAQTNPQEVFLMLVRNDYMICLPKEYQSSNEDIDSLVMKPGVSLKQVEYNLMSASYSGMAQKVTDFHKLNLKLVGIDDNEIIDKIPSNHPAQGFARGMVCAWKLYNKSSSVILFVISDSERNIFDQRILEQCVYSQNPNVLVIRKTFEECLSEGQLRDDNTLWINQYEVSVVYFRHGYAPEHFYNEKIWESKLMLEKSRAIKCPNIQQILVNTKLVQQAMCNYSFLKKYLPDNVSQELIETFANQYLLKDKDKIHDALQFPDKYVLKPQREGGGNNYFDDDLVEKLNQIKKTEEKNKYVLMERIYPASCENLILKSNGEIVNERVVSELGIYGVFLGTDKDIFCNYQCGHLLRSKPIYMKETGISAGFGCIDSLYLV